MTRSVGTGSYLRPQIGQTSFHPYSILEKMMQAVCTHRSAVIAPLDKCAKRTSLPRRLALSLTAFATLALVTASAQSAGRVFYDGFESGNTSLWSRDAARNSCQVVASPSDGVTGPYAGSRMARCNWNGTVAWNDPAAYETLITNIPYTNEFLIRLRLRLDRNFSTTTGSATKIMRFFNWTGDQSTYLDIYGGLYGTSITNYVLVSGAAQPNYWGDKDNAGNPSSWHKVEYYVNQSSGVVKVWHDGVMVRNATGLNFNGVKVPPLNLTSNWSDAHDAENFLYFDEVEIFSDTGTGASGLMSDASASATGSSTITPTTLRVTGTAP
jgi:hypothetical protein